MAVQQLGMSYSTSGYGSLIGHFNLQRRCGCPGFIWLGVLSDVSKSELGKFQIVGIEDNDNLHSAPDNVVFSGRLNHIELRKAYRKAQFHFQLSLFEGFGLSLCEAMLCECIPIGSSVNMIPQIIGDTGFILNQKKIDLLIDIMKKAIATNNKEDLGKKARQRIVENFNADISIHNFLNALKVCLRIPIYIKDYRI